MRCVSIATWTSGEPVSPGIRACSVMSWVLRAVSSGICGHATTPYGACRRSGRTVWTRTRGIGRTLGWSENNRYDDDRSGMAILCISTVPAEVPLDQVLAVSKAIAAGGPPAGGISHAVIVDGGRIKIYDVWKSEEAMNTFTADRLLPAIAKQKAAMGAGPSAPPQPAIPILAAHDA